MNEVAILSAVRTPIGNFGGVFIDISAAQLGEVVARAAMHKAGIAPDQVDETIFGCARQAGIGPNIARQIAWRSGIPEAKAAYTVNKACGSGLKSITLGAQSIMLGENQIVLAGGVEQMSQIPYLLTKARWGYRLGDDVLVDSNYRDGYNCPLAEMVMGETVDRLAEEYGISRVEQDAFAAESHQKAWAAWESGAFDAEVVPVETRGAKGATLVIHKDERPRADSTPEKLAKLKPVFRTAEEGGTITAANASGITDGAAAVILMRADIARAEGLQSLATIGGFASAGVAPERMGLGPVPATRKLLEITGLGLDDFDLIEVNEAFAAQVLIVERELPWDTERRNVNGGAVALGHPTGCTGARILVTLLHAMQKRDAELGLATLCISGGLGMSLALGRS
ncbi:MAG: thiolase family protein [Chloroflexi bacterium]|nr:thiolase family protein [Chloroflexota bacterium]MBU1660699.1 thiolase family protein [Chloroflexota bacterium]